MWRQPRPRLFRKNDTAQVEQGWRLRGKQCQSHHRYREAWIGGTHAGLLRPTDSSRKFEARGNSPPQPLHRPRSLRHSHAAARGNQSKPNLVLTLTRASHAYPYSGARCTIGFIDVPFTRDLTLLPIETFKQFRTETNNSAMHRRMVQINATFSHHLL